MARFRGPQNAFINGEITPLAQARTNIQEYANAVSLMQNALILPQGGCEKRKGFEIKLDEFHQNGHGSSAVQTNEPLGVIPFHFSDDEKYVVILDEGIGFYAYNLSTLAVASVSIGSPGTDTTAMSLVTAISTDFRDFHKFQYAQKGALLFIVHPDNVPIVIRRTALNTLEFSEFYDQADTVTDAVAAERWPFREKNLDQSFNMTLSAVAAGIRTVTASDDFFDSGHIGSPMYFGESGSDAGWGTITDVTNATTAEIIIQLAAPASYASGHWEWAESSWSNFRGWPRTVTFHEGRVYYGGNDAEPGKLWASQAEDLFQMTRVETEISSGSSATELNSDPYQFTLSGAKYSQIQWMIGGPTLRLGTVMEEHILQGIDPSLIMGKTNPTSGSLVTSIGSHNVMPVIGQSNVYFVQRSGDRIRELRFNRDINNYLSTDVTVLAEQIPKRSKDIFNDGLTPKIAKLAIQQHNATVIWALDNNGALFSGTVDRTLGVVGWQRHVLVGQHAQKAGVISGGFTAFGNPTNITLNSGHGMSNGDTIVIANDNAFTPSIDGSHTLTLIAGDTFSIPVETTALSGPQFLWSSNVYDDEPRVTSIFTMPSSDNTHDDLWAVVIRAYDGVNRTTLEKITKRFDGTRLDEQSTTQEQKPIFMDGAVMNQVASFPNGTATTTHSGFDIYAGDTVAVLADGQYVGTKLVSDSGVITLDLAAQEVIAGKNFSMRVKLLPIDIGSQLGSAFTAVQRIEKVLVKLFKTAFLKFGTSFDNMYEFVFTDVNDPQEDTIELFTGVKEEDFPGDYDREAVVCFESDVPYPCTIGGVVMEGITYDD